MVSGQDSTADTLRTICSTRAGLVSSDEPALLRPGARRRLCCECCWRAMRKGLVSSDEPALLCPGARHRLCCDACQRAACASALSSPTLILRSGDAPVADEVDRAAHVDVHKVDGRVVLDQLRAARERVRVAAADLRRAAQPR